MFTRLSWKFGLLLAALPLFAFNAAAADGQSDIQNLEKRVEELEKRFEQTETVDERSHRLHPVHSAYGIKIEGGLTMVGQGVYGLKPGDKQPFEGALSADLALESPVGRQGRAVIVFDIERGGGLGMIPELFKSPNGNPTGTNADVESFNNDQAHATELYYEHNIDDVLVMTVGQAGINGFFDANAYANDEKAQFMANTFVNNPTIEWGGSENFYALGARVTISPFNGVDLTAGAFDGDGDYSESFDRPFVMTELDVNTSIFGREGNYRFYYWNRQGRPVASVADTATPDDPALEKAANQGGGISFDQEVLDGAGLWLRAGIQRHKVARADRFFGGGLHFKGIAGRAEDTFGIGYGVNIMGKDYKQYLALNQPEFKTASEHYMEAYYDIAVDGAGEGTGFHIAPDVQYVVNPGGAANAAHFFVYGMRLQTYF